VFTITGYSGIDPEASSVAFTNTTSNFGIDNNLYPRSRTYLVGAGIDF
jgi:iron complex outermembrane receptor protein